MNFIMAWLRYLQHSQVVQMLWRVQPYWYMCAALAVCLCHNTWYICMEP